MRTVMIFALALIASICQGQVLIAYDTDTLIGGGITTYYGTFGIGLTDGRTLTYGGYIFAGGGTTVMSFNLDGDIYGNNPSPPPGVTPIFPSSVVYSELENILIADWFIGDSIQYTMTLHPFSTDSLIAVAINYTVTNHDTLPHEVGVLLFLDVNVSGVDGAPFVFPDGSSHDSTTVLSGSDIPSYCYLFEHDPFDPEEDLLAVLYIHDPVYDGPDWFAIGNQRTCTSLIVWDPSILPIEEITDGAVILVWGAIEILPDSIATFQTTYGIIPYSGISENQRKPDEISFNVYPNPFNSSCAITASRPGGKIEIYDLRGNVVCAHCVETGLKPVSTNRTFTWQPDESIASGIYIIRATTDDGRKESKPVVYIR